MSVREQELQRLLKHAKAASEQGGLFLLSPPAAGASILLLETHALLTAEHGEVIPIYFAFDRRDETVEKACFRFVREFLSQFAAFGRSSWLDELAGEYSQINADGGNASLIKACFELPNLAGAVGKRCFVMLDSMHEIAFMRNADGFVSQIKRQWEDAPFRYVFSAYRRFFGKDFDLPRLMVDRLDDKQASRIIEQYAAKYSVSLNDECRDLLATQLGGDIENIESVIRRATAENITLDSFSNVQRAYAEEIFSGGICTYFDAVIASAAPSARDAADLIALLYDSAKAKLSPVDAWRARLGLDEGQFARMLNVLHMEELIRLSSNRVEVMSERLAFGDYISGRHRLEIKRETRARVFADELIRYMRRAPELMARRYRRSQALDLKQVLSRFDRQEVPLAMFDYASFKENYKGLGTPDMNAKLAGDKTTLRLPKVIFAASTDSFYPNIREHIDSERSAVGVAFETAGYKAEDEVVWLAAEIDSKLEVERETAEFWCDRLETAALMCDFANYIIWLIAPEGFTADALEIIRQRNGFGSSRRQVEMLQEHFTGKVSHRSAETETDGYSITIPMGSDGELIAAHTLEDIARKHDVGSGMINQMKTAVVEACINAAEHGSSPDGQIRLSFNVDAERMNITVANRGLRLADVQKSADRESQARRGWGLKLMERLMDEVRLEQTDDGTTIKMSKLLAA